MILAIDIGNSNITFGLCEGQEISKPFRISTDRWLVADNYRVIFSSLLGPGVEPEGVVVSSVVPMLDPEFSRMCREWWGLEAVFVRPHEMSILPMHVDDPRQVGADRVVNCYAAERLYGRPAVVVDFGTATTFDVLSEAGAYEGGLILPGVRVAAESLSQRTALLPRLDFRKPESIIGKNTAASMRAGLFYGLLGQIEGIVERLREEIPNQGLQVVATGGLCEIIGDECPLIDIIDPMLTLKGLAMIYEDINEE